MSWGFLDCLPCVLYRFWHCWCCVHGIPLVGLMSMMGLRWLRWLGCPTLSVTPRHNCKYRQSGTECIEAWLGRVSPVD